MKFYKGIHREWNIERYGDSPGDIAEQIGCNVKDLEISEIDKMEYLLDKVPIQFRSALSSMAYDRGHAWGEEEVVSTLESLIHDLLPAIESYKQALCLQSNL